MIYDLVSTHSRPKAAADYYMFADGRCFVSTHSRPKAAANHRPPLRGKRAGFNTQPPEGGCSLHKKARKISVLNTVFR